jgi:hypothetical protein
MLHTENEFWCFWWFYQSQIKANSHVPCHVHAALIHTCHAAPMPCFKSAVSFVKVCVVAGNIRTASPTVHWINFFKCVATSLYSCRYGSLCAGCDHCLLALPSFRRRNTKKTKILDPCVPSKKRGRRISDCLDVWKMTGKKFSNILEWVSWNLKTWNSCCTDIEKKNTQWTENIRTEERLALTS